MRYFIIATLVLLLSCKTEKTTDEKDYDVLGIIQTRHSDEISESYWGIQTGSLDETGTAPWLRKLV
jgi:hypothetical protein